LSVSGVLGAGGVVPFGGAVVSSGPQPAADRATDANTTAVGTRHLVRTHRMPFIVIELLPLAELPGPATNPRAPTPTRIERLRTEPRFRARHRTIFNILDADPQAVNKSIQTNRFKIQNR